MRKNEMVETIEDVAKNIETLLNTEEAKVRVLEREFAYLRGAQVPILTGAETLIEDEENEEIAVQVNQFRRILRGLQEVILGQFKKFDNDRKVAEKIDQHLKIIREMDRLLIFYKSTRNKDHLKQTYNKLLELMTSFKTVSKSIVDIKRAESEKLARKAA